MPRLDAEMSVKEIAEAHPTLIPVLRDYGLDPTVQRSLAFESLMASCLVHQVSLEHLLNVLENALELSAEANTTETETP